MKKRLLAILMTVLMAVTMLPIGAGMAYAADLPARNLPGPESGSEQVESDYLTKDFLTMQKQEALRLSDGMDQTSVNAESHGFGALLSGPVSELESGRLQIANEFDFSGNPVGRISLHGVAERGVIVEALIYLDAEEEPVCTFALDNRGKKGGWNIGEAVSESVYSKKITGSHKVSIGFRISGKSGEQKTNILLRTIEFAEDPGIPTLYFQIDEDQNSIDEMNNSKDHSVECYGSVDIKVPDGFQSEYEETPMGDLSVDLQYIRGRGNSTWEADKKPYKFKLASKKNLFGMGKNAHWVLLANRYDNSLLRNRMTYWLAREMGMEFTPKCVPVEVVMNGEYYGSYLLCEQVRVGSSRVDIDELTAEDTTLPNLSGGYLLAMSPYGEEDKRSIFSTKHNVCFLNDNPDFVEYESPEQTAYIRGYIQDTEDAIFGNDFKNTESKSWQEFMDLKAAAGYWWVQEFSMNGDAYATSSTYLYKKRDDKLFWGPLWDFDYVAWGNLESPDDLQTDGFENASMPWFDILLGDPDFTDELLQRWNQINPLITRIVEEGGILDQYYRQMEISQRYENEKYGYFNEGGFFGADKGISIIEPGEGGTNGTGQETKPHHTYRDEIEQLRAWVASRQSWVNENLASLKTLTKTVTFVIDGTVIGKRVAKGGLSRLDIPKAPEKEGLLFEGWFTDPKDGERMDPHDGWIEVNEDMTLYGRYSDEKTAVKADTILLRNDRMWVNINDEEYYPIFVTLPNDAVDNRITWTSSNETVATVEEDGKVTLRMPGTTMITGTLRCGASASCALHVYDPDETELVPPEELVVESEEVTLEMGQYGFNPFKLLPENEPVNGNAVYFESDDESVVVVGACGELYPMGPGTATVTVTDYISGLGISYQVTVVGGEEENSPIDAIDNAITMLMQMNRLINKADYTNASYAAYLAVYKNALKTLMEGEVSVEEISEIRHEVIVAQLSLKKKAANPMKVKAKTVTIGKSKVRKKALKIKCSKAFRIKKAKGKLTFAKVAKGSSNNLLINKKTGTIIVKKGTGKGLYRINVRITAAGNGIFKPCSKIVTVTVKVR